ncbi:hypothetical protein Tco_0150551 [Tanacetum coccineum]
MDDSRESFNELMNTPFDFSAFVMNRLKVYTLTPELLAGPTFELMKGSCKSQQYPHDLREPLPLPKIYHFSDQRQGCRITGHFKWIGRDLVPPQQKCGVKFRLAVKKHASGESHIGVKNDNYSMDLRCGVFNRNSSRVSTPKEATPKQNHWIDDDKLYKFKEGDFNRLHIQDIEDMLLLLVQGKLTNLTVEECLAFNVSLRMFTRSVVIPQGVWQDLQLGIQSYQKKLNLTKPNTYRSYLKRMEAYTAYSNLRGFIYHNKDKKNRLMCIDELHKFSDGTLNDVQTALDDLLKGIRMKYLPQTI